MDITFHGLEMCSFLFCEFLVKCLEFGSFVLQTVFTLQRSHIDFNATSERFINTMKLEEKKKLCNDFKFALEWSLFRILFPPTSFELFDSAFAKLCLKLVGRNKLLSFAYNYFNKKSKRVTSWTRFWNLPVLLKFRFHLLNHCSYLSRYTVNKMKLINIQTSY